MFANVNQCKIQSLFLLLLWALIYTENSSGLCLLGLTSFFRWQGISEKGKSSMRKESQGLPAESQLNPETQAHAFYSVDSSTQGSWRPYHSILLLLGSLELQFDQQAPLLAG